MEEKPAATDFAEEPRSNPASASDDEGMGAAALAEAIVKGIPPAEGGPSWEEASSAQKRDRAVYVAGRGAISILKAVGFTIAALFAAVFGLASKQNPRKKYR